MKDFFPILRVQLLKDIRSQAWLLILFFLALVLKLIYNLGGFGPKLMGDFAFGILEFLTVVCGIIVSVRVVVEDTPAQRERFLATRPMPVINLAAAKAILLRWYCYAFQAI